MVRIVALFLVVCAALAAKPNYPIEIKGSGEGSFSPVPIKPGVVSDPVNYDAIVVGGGLAGMSAALYLSDQGKTVLVLEKEPQLGGLAAGGMIGEVKYGRGASYFTQAYEEERMILERIGMGDYKERYAIHEPSDSYFWNGKLFLGIWEEHTLEQLPATFELFKYELEKADEEGFIPNQPIEKAQKRRLDALNATDWVRSMPKTISERTDEEAKRIWKRVSEDKTTDPADPMKDVMGLLNLYCRSALGAPCENISAIAFANFYISEVETRYTTETGTGGAGERLEKLLKDIPSRVTLRTGAPVIRILDDPTKVEVRYVVDGQEHEARGGYAILAAQLKLALKIIPNFEKRDPKRAALLKKLKYAHYNVHNVQVKGHPYRATYDTWTRGKDATLRDFCDLILGRWMDPEIRGYEGMRDFTKHPKDDIGVFSLYQPLPLERVGDGYTEEEARDDAEYSTERMLALYGPLLKKTWGTSIEVQRVVTSRWPYSIHLVAPGHFGTSSKILRKPLGRILFANNNIGTPTFEEALFRGHCAANNILKKEMPGFEQEKWSKCPLDLQ